MVLRTYYSLLVAFLSVLFCAQIGFAQGAQETELEAQGQSLKTTVVIPSDGVMTYSGDISRAATYAKVLDNLHMLRRGVWSSRGCGYTVAGTIGGSVEGLAGYCDQQGSDQILALSSTSQAFIFNPVTGVSLDVSGNYAAVPGNYPTARSSFDATGIVITNGSPQIYTLGLNTGTDSVVASGNWPVTGLDGNSYSNPFLNERYYSRHVYAGFGGFPNTLLISADDSVNNWTHATPAAVSDAGALQTPPYLGHITGLYNIRQSQSSNAQTLLIGCENGMCALTGTDPTSYTISVISDTWGILSNHTWYENDNDVYFLATDGIRRLSNTVFGASLVPSLVSTPVQDLINKMDNSNGDAAFVLPHRASQEAIFFFPTTNTDAGNADSGNPGLIQTDQFGSGQHDGGNGGGGTNNQYGPNRPDGTGGGTLNGGGSGTGGGGSGAPGGG